MPDDAPASIARRPRGVAPALLASQVASTAPWTLGSSHPAAAVVHAAPRIEERWKLDEGDVRYFELLLAAHYLTVATFVPTDVDSRIRHHAWVDASAERVSAYLDVLEPALGWDARRVSARTVADPRAPEERVISGHDGEWLSVLAGALGRALVLDDERSIARCAEAIDASLDRQAKVYRAIEESGAVLDLVRAATVLAHNAGDLSRVVEEWPRRPELGAHRERLCKLGHERAHRHGGAFVRAGALNKALTAVENHRFLALRAPRCLRRSRALLLPIGPFFDDWGRDVAKSPLVEQTDRAEVVEALLQIHVAGPEQWGCLRALAALHEHSPGGLERVAPDLPARLRKLVSGGAVRDALKTSKSAFEGRYAARARTLASGLGR